MPWLPISHQRQRQMADCLAACAATVLVYWQQPVAYDDLRKLLRIGHALQVHLYNLAFSDASCTIPID